MTNEKRIVAIFDNEGKSLDRFTVVYYDKSCLSMSHNPTSPNGFACHDLLHRFSLSDISGGASYLGRQIQLEELPGECRDLAQKDLDNIPGWACA